MHIKLLNLEKRSQIVSAGDFNLFLSSQLEADGGNPSFKSKYVSKLYEISKTLDLCDIRQVKNRDKKISLCVKYFSNTFSGII